MSRSLAANAGSLDSLKVRTRCGRSLCARQTRSTELALMPTAAAMAPAVQCVASCGGSVGVSSTTRSIVACAKGGTRDGLDLSRKSPGTPSRMNRACQRQTHGFDTPARRMIAFVPSPSAVARMILARQTCFCGLFRSATTAAKRARSAALTSTLTPLRIPAGGHAHSRRESSVRCDPLADRFPEPRFRAVAERLGRLTVRRHWADVERVAEALVDRRSLTPMELAGLIGRRRRI